MEADVVLPEPLGRIKCTSLQRALDEFSLGTLISVAPTISGNLRQNAFLQTSLGNFVFRGAPTFPGQFSKERYFSQLIAERTTLAAPWPYHTCELPDHFDWPIAIMPRLDGFEIGDVFPLEHRTTDDWQAIARAQAHALVNLQAATFDRPGEFSVETGQTVPLPGSFSERVVQKVSDTLESLTDERPEDADKIMERVHTWHRRIVASTPNIIVHGDFGYWNMLFVGNRDDLTVKGVFDFATATIGDPVADLAYQYPSYVHHDREAADEFVASYLRLIGSVPPSFQDRFHLYLFHERLNLRAHAFRHALSWIDWDIPIDDWLSSYMLSDDLSSAVAAHS